MDSDDLLRTKLMRPRANPALLVRPHLFERLDEGLFKKMTLIAAPTGYGKTTVAGLWLAERQLPAAWVNLDQGDNDPVRFWRYVISACQIFDEVDGKQVLATLRSAKQPSLQLLLTQWINGLTGLQQKIVLVLEDYHTITSTEVAETLSFLIENMPVNLHLVLITRSQPGNQLDNESLPLALLRARNELNEIRAGDLLFSNQEINEFIEQTFATPLSPAIVRQLEQKTEGWPAGLRLVSLAIQHSEGPEQIEQTIANFSGEHRFVLEYLGNEVLLRQPENIRSFLLQTSFLNRLTHALCDAVLQRQDSRSILRQLDEANLFLIPLHSSSERSWYRYQALFAEATNQIALQTYGEEKLQALQARASQWYIEHGLIEEAVETVLSAGLFEHAAELIDLFVDQRGWSEIHTLRRWYEQLPVNIVLDHPQLCFAFALSLLFTSDRYAPTTPAQLEPLLHAAETAWQDESNRMNLGKLENVRAIIAWWQGDLEQSFARNRRALDLLPENEVFWRGTSLLSLGYEDLLAGKFYAAQNRLMEARALCGAGQNMHGVLAAVQFLGEIAFQQCDLDQSAAYYNQILADVTDSDAMLDDIAEAYQGLGYIRYEQNDLNAAKELATKAQQIAIQRSDENRQVYASILLSLIEGAQGNYQQAQDMLTSLMAGVRRPYLVRELEIHLAWLCLAAGDLVSARHWYKTISSQEKARYTIQEEQVVLLSARLLLAEREPAGALHATGAMRREARINGRVRSEITLLNLEAAAYFAQGDPTRATQSITNALSIAQPKGLRRIFIDEGEGLAALLKSVLPNLRKRILSMYATALLHAFPSATLQKSAQPDERSWIEPLSAQELRVLKLITAGLSNPEIAQELVVSINTVKTQVRSIYRKLNVENREEARQAAQELKII